MHFRRSLVSAAFLAGLLTVAGCDGGSEDSPPNAPTGNISLVVTTSATHVSTSPTAGTSLFVNSGKTLTITVTPDTGYAVASVVGGTCPAGSWNGSAYVTGAITADCALAFGATQNVYSVTPSFDTGVTAAPSTAQSVPHGGTQVFSVTPAAGYLVSIDGTCPAGTFAGTSYTTGIVISSCTVHFGSTLTTTHVTATGDAHASVLPNATQTVNYGAAQAFTLTIATGYSVTAGGTCAAGSLIGSTYTTGAVTADCTVTFTSALKTLTVTPTGDGHVVISPSTPQTVPYGVTESFTVTAASGYTLSRSVGGNCPAGAFGGNLYIMGLITADCAVSFSSFLNWSGVRQQGVASTQTEGGGTAVDSLGNVYVVGFTQGALNGSPLIGTRDAFLAKYAPSGGLTWLKHLGIAAHSTTGQAISIDRGGNIYISGFTDGGLNGNTLSGYEDYFVARYAADGTLVWVKQAGPPGATSNAAGVTTDSAGDIYLAGNTTGDLNGNLQTGTYDYFVARYDANGNLVWLKQLGSPGVQSFASNAKVDSSGNVFVAGTARGGLAGNTQSGNFDYLLAKYDSAGNLLWLKQSGVASQITTGLAVVLDSSGNPIMTGITTAGLHGNSQNGANDYYITKYDTNGTLIWLEQVGVASKDTGPMSVTLDSADNVLVTGYTNGSLAGNTLTGQYDAFIAKHDTNGNLTWLKQLGTSTNVLTAGNSVAVDWADNIFITGYTEGSLPGNTVAGTRDYWLAKYDASGARQ